MDLLPEGPTQLLRPRRLPLLLQPAALHQPRHQDARQGHHPGGLLHAGQQVGSSARGPISCLSVGVGTSFPRSLQFTQAFSPLSQVPLTLGSGPLDRATAEHCGKTVALKPKEANFPVRPKQTGAGVTFSAAVSVTLNSLNWPRQSINQLFNQSINQL